MKTRYDILDTVRGITLVSMILYHAVWDLVYIFGVSAPWYETTAAYIWQQSICWTFILLSGFCWSMGRKHVKRGLMVLGTSIIISLVTIIFMPENTIMFGVLSMIGTAMLLMIPLDYILKKINPYCGMAVAFILFVLVRNIPQGELGFEGWHILGLPQEWYSNLFTAYLGFPATNFYSADYFPILPWIFLYITGYFLYHILKRKEKLPVLKQKGITLFSFVGRHSLIVYALHQPVIYGALYIWFYFVRNLL